MLDLLGRTYFCPACARHREEENRKVVYLHPRLCAWHIERLRAMMGQPEHDGNLLIFWYGFMKTGDGFSQSV